METFSALPPICARNSAVPGNSPHKGQWRGALMFSLICAWIYGWVNNREAGDLRRHRAHNDVTVMRCPKEHESGRCHQMETFFRLTGPFFIGIVFSIWNMVYCRYMIILLATKCHIWRHWAVACAKNYFFLAIWWPRMNDGNNVSVEFEL